MYINGHIRPVLQQEARECGAACLTMVVNMLGGDVSLTQVRTILSNGNGDQRLGDIIAAGKDLGLKSRVLKLSIPQIKRHEKPLLLHWDFEHFVLLESYRKDKFVILDPAVGRRVVSADDFGKSYTGVLVYFSRDESKSIPTDSVRDRLQVRHIWPRFAGQQKVVVLLMLISVLHFLLMLGSPLFTAYLLDEALTIGSAQLVAFASVLILFSLSLAAVTKYLQRRLLLEYSQAVSKRLMTRIVARMLALDVRWYHSRSTGRIMSKLSSASSVQEFVVSQGLLAIVDALVIFPIIIAIAFIDLSLAAVLSVGMIAQVVTLVMVSERAKVHSVERINARSKSDTAFVEFSGNIEAVKVRSGEESSFNRWFNSYLKTLKAERKHERLTSFGDGFSELIQGLTFASIIFVAANLVIQDHLSFGGVVALVMLLGIAGSAVHRAASFFRDLSAMRVNLDNLSDLFGSGSENSVRQDADIERESLSHLAPFTKGPIELELISFSVAAGGTGQQILQDAQLQLKAGGSYGLIGGSGVGKTTVINTILGLHPYATGKLIVNNHELPSNALSQLRQNVGTVLQGDQLFSGTIAENISSFKADATMDEITAAAQLAEIDEDIRALPLGYNTRVGTGGQRLSGGQEQRVMIARAVYGTPGLLILDEGTAHLDLSLERKIVSNLSKLKMTKLVVSHRPQTLLEFGTKIYELRDRQFFRTHKLALSGGELSVVS